MVVRDLPATSSSSPCQWKKGGLAWAFSTPLRSLSHGYLCLVSSLLHLYPFAFSLLLFLFLCLYPSVPYLLCLYVSVFLPNLLTSNIPHLTMPLLSSLSPKTPLPLNLPPASSGVQYNRVGREQGVMLHLKRWRWSLGLGSRGSGLGVSRAGSVGEHPLSPHLRSSHSDPPPCQGSVSRR